MSNTEEFWQGEFGNDYTERNANILPAQISFFSKVLKNKQINSVLELGANIGINLDALKLLYPHLDGTGVEINKEACDKIYPEFRAVNSSILRFGYDEAAGRTYDLVLTKGVLIHTPPDELNDVYEIMSNFSHKYILIAEYYNPTPVEVKYHGFTGKLWKRDFAKEFLQTCPDFELDDYGFVYHGDTHPQDDLTYFLMRRM